MHRHLNPAFVNALIKKTAKVVFPVPPLIELMDIVFIITSFVF
jgi:hypothetical protein